MDLLKLKIILMKKICLGIMPKTYNRQRKEADALSNLYCSYSNTITNNFNNKELLEKCENIMFILVLNMIILSRSNYKKYTSENYREIEARIVWIKNTLHVIKNVHRRMRF